MHCALQVTDLTGIRDVTEPGVVLIADAVTTAGGWTSNHPAIIMIPGIKTALGDMNEFENLNQRDQEAKVRAYIYGAHGPGKITLIDGAHRWANSAGFP